ncbi:hypothetical protein BVRB_3g069630 [Beta vulgaris subsp. vulgaris]|nr:hypothetical protein BVRB_3g069630 [Beta vulgaris subsp. vulgaris]
MPAGSFTVLSTVFTIQDISNLSSINLRYAGYVVTVKVEVKDDTPVDSLSPSIETFDQPEAAIDHHKWETQSEQSDARRLSTSQAFVEKLLEESLAKLQEENTKEEVSGGAVAGLVVQYLGIGSGSD